MFAQQPMLVEILAEQKIVSEGLRTLSANSSSAMKLCHLSTTLLLFVIVGSPSSVRVAYSRVKHVSRLKFVWHLLSPTVSRAGWFLIIAN
jgi:hypothetical protein